MSGSNPFDDLAEDAEENDKGVEDETASRTVTDQQVATESRTERRETSRETSIEGPSLSNSSPPFPYSEAQQKQMYVQDGLWEEFEDLGFDAELELRRSFDVRNVEHRELDTAIIRLALERFTARDIAKMVIQMRGYDPADLD